MIITIAVDVSIVVAMEDIIKFMTATNLRTANQNHHRLIDKNDHDNNAEHFHR
jgi:hypothetical protein